MSGSKTDLSNDRKVQKTIKGFKSAHGSTPITYQQLELGFSSEARLPQRMATLPFFRPVKNRKLFDTDVNEGERIDTEWGYVIRIGPGLNQFDEDTLLAMLNLCEVRMLCMQDEYDHPVNVHAGYLTPAEINRFLKRDRSDDTLNETRRSIKRLQRNYIELYHVPKNYTETLHFLKIRGSINAKGPLYVEIPPVTVKWLDDFIALDMDLRRTLTPVGKAVHRFLSACPRDNIISLSELAQSIGTNLSISEFRRSLAPKKLSTKSQLEIMKQHHFLKSYEIKGTGRSTPLTLHSQRY